MRLVCVKFGEGVMGECEVRVYVKFGEGVKVGTMWCEGCEGSG